MTNDLLFEFLQSGGNPVPIEEIIKACIKIHNQEVAEKRFVENCRFAGVGNKQIKIVYDTGWWCSDEYSLDAN